jgi:hypothetical protein
MKAVVTCLASLAIVISGCSGGAEGQVDVYPVSGKVVLGAGPVVKASVTFSPIDGQPVAYGMTDNQGQFQLTTYDSFDGAAEGNYEVLITKSAASPSSGGPPTHDATGSSNTVSAPSHDAGAGAEGGAGTLIDPKWSQHGNGLTAEVKPGGDNTFEFKLN